MRWIVETNASRQTGPGFMHGSETIADDVDSCATRHSASWMCLSFGSCEQEDRDYKRKHSRVGTEAPDLVFLASSWRVSGLHSALCSYPAVNVGN